MNDVTVLIAGAGIGGLATALALHRRGIDAIVIERAAELRPLGVGINLLPRAVGELDRLGVAGQTADHAAAPRAIEFHDAHGHLLFREPRGIDGGYRWPQLSVHRGRLQAVLLSAVRDRLSPSAVRLAHRLIDFDERDDGVLVRTSAETLSTDLLVGADGIHSVVRKQLHPSDDRLLWSGTRMFRGATSAPSFLDGETMAIVKGDGVELVVYPIGDGLINWVVQVDEAEPGPLPGDATWNSHADRAAVIEHLSALRLDWLDVAALVRNAETVLEYPMVDRDPLPWWTPPDGPGRVTLLGDAAHPMYPVGANGGSQSIIDATTLAGELARDPREGLRAYEIRRRPETAEVIIANRTMHGTGSGPADLARTTTRYRRRTHTDRS